MPERPPGMLLEGGWPGLGRRISHTMSHSLVYLRPSSSSPPTHTQIVCVKKFKDRLWLTHLLSLAVIIILIIIYVAFLPPLLLKLLLASEHVLRLIFTQDCNITTALLHFGKSVLATIWDLFRQWMIDEMTGDSLRPKRTRRTRKGLWGSKTDWLCIHSGMHGCITSSIDFIPCGQISSKPLESDRTLLFLIL